LAGRFDELRTRSAVIPSPGGEGKGEGGRKHYSVTPHGITLKFPWFHGKLAGGNSSPVISQGNGDSALRTPNSALSHPLDFLVPDGLELLRRDRRGCRINSNHEGILAVGSIQHAKWEQQPGF
jgi:hypothetical protein